MVFDGVTDFNGLYLKWIGSLNPDAAVCCFNNQEITAQAFNRLVEGYMGCLSRYGIGPGAGVGYTMPNCPEVLALFFAVSRIGAYAVPLFHMTPDKVKTAVFKQSRVQLVITAPDAYDTFVRDAGGDEAPFTIITSEVNENDAVDPSAMAGCNGTAIPGFSFMPALMASSSGTTGIPKAVMINQMNMLSSLRCSSAMAQPLRATGVKHPSTVIAFPLSTSGVLVCSGLLFAGVKLVFSADLSPVRYLELIDRWKATSMSAPPSYFEALLTLPHIQQSDVSPVRTVMTGMDFFSPSLLERITEKFPGVDSLSSGYGLVETSTVVMVHNVTAGGDLSGGTNVVTLPKGSGHAVAIRDDQDKPLSDGTTGTLWIKGPSVVKEYLGHPKETEASFRDGWFNTGDVAKKIDDSTVELLGRKKYLIKRGGKSVSPFVVQERINKAAGVTDCAVVGVPHLLYGQMIFAFVVASPPDGTVEREIMKQCRESLPNFMVPDTIHFIDAIPKKNGVGKVNYEQLLEMAKQEIETIGGMQNG
jgi:acyl-CoA synthetase (AMP-forming)/AMP-acid ligase II